MSERLAEAAEAVADTTDAGRVPGVPRTSPWQRSNAVWHHAGIDWSRVTPDTPPATEPVADDAASGEAEPWGPARGGRGLPAVPLTPVAIGAAAVLVLGGGAYLLFSGDDAPAKPTTTPAVAADRFFTADPAATASGRVGTLDGVAAADRTVVAIGSEQGGVYARGRFLVSTDGGGAWRAARVEGDPPQGEYPRFVAGGAGAWAALGGTASWTSHDALTWTRQAVTGAFATGDRIAGLARTGSGFVAVGSARAGNGTQAVVWTSRDGRAWTRTGADRLAPPPGGTVVDLREVGAHGDTVLARGTLRTTQTVKRKKKKVRRTVDAEAFWRSPDGGRSWEPVAIPQAQGSSGRAVAAVATQAGFFAAREASRKTGKKKKTVHDAVVFGSQDGQRWAPVGRLSAGGYAKLGGLRGDVSGLTGLVSVKGGKTTVVTSGDGRTWRHVGDLPGGRRLTGAALAPQGPVVTGRLGSGDAYLTVAGGGDVALASVPGAVHPERTVAGIASAPGQTVAFGSTNGRPALWTSPNGTAWTRAALPAPSGPGTGRLTDTAHGGQGWLAVGGEALTSADGRTWQAVSVSKGLAPVAAAANGSAYVMVGKRGAAYSNDLKSWSASRGDLGKDAMNDVAAGQAGFVAVGGRTVNGAAMPALWTSSDGKSWASATPPPLPNGATTGSLTGIVARGGALVATGTAGARAFAAVSADGGRTWRPVALPGAAAEVTAATVTPHGFVLAGTAGSDVVLWTSADGAAWTLVRPHGLGLDGPGVQRLDGLTVIGGDLTAVGFTADQRTDGATLWRRPVP